MPAEIVITTPAGAKSKLAAHVWEREVNEHYCEPKWCSNRLLEEESFEGCIDDPCCGFGTIPLNFTAKGFQGTASDLVDRGFRNGKTDDFLKSEWRRDNIICNPPFNIANHFVLHALQVASRKIAMIFPTARLNAAHWIRGTPLRRVWLLTPRPSMPPGHVIAAGGKPGGGKMDYCWMVWEQSYKGQPELRWLRRDGN